VRNGRKETKEKGNKGERRRRRREAEENVRRPQNFPTNLNRRFAKNTIAIKIW